MLRAGRLAMQVAQQFEPARCHGPGKQLEGLEPDMPFRVLLCQLAAFGAMPGVDEALRHGIKAVADMDL